MNSFNPELYDDDIVVVEMESLGWRKGFEVTTEYSALDDEAITNRITIRARAQLEDEVHSLTEKLKKAIAKYEDVLEEKSDDNAELLSLINEALGDVYDEEFVDLASAIEVLVEEYNKAVEETKDEG